MHYVTFYVWLLSLNIMFSRLIHVVACVTTSFLLMGEQYSIARLYSTLSNHSSVDGHLGCFYLLTIVNSATMNIHIQIFKYLFSIPFSLHLKVELTSDMVFLCLIFWGTAKLFSTVAVPFYIPTSTVQELQFSPHLHQHCYFLRFIYFYFFGCVGS